MKTGKLSTMCRKLWDWENRDLAVLYFIDIVVSVLLITFWGVQYIGDSPSYESAWRDSLSSWNIDIYRTPVYPLFIGLLQTVFGREYWSVAAICVQYLVFLFSIKYFYRLATYITSSRMKVFVITMFYIFPFMTWCSITQTESLAYSGSVLLIYYIRKLYVGSCSSADWIRYVLLLLFLIFLRPAFLYILPVLSVWWLLAGLDKRSYKTVLSGLGGVVIVLASLFGYMRAYENKYGVFAVSCVGTINQLYIALENDLISPETIQDNELREDIACVRQRISGKQSGIYSEVYGILDRHEMGVVHQMMADSYANSLPKYLLSRFRNLYKSANECLVVIWSGPLCLFTIYNLLGIKMGLLYLFVLICTVMTVRHVYKTGKVPMVWLLLYMLLAGNLIMVFVGAQNEWNRLIVPSIPLFLLMACGFREFVGRPK